MGSTISEKKIKYERFRHHAWAGLGFLSVFLSVRYFVSFPDSIFLPILSFILVYVVFSLLLTYRYRSDSGDISPHLHEIKKSMESHNKEKKKVAKSKLKSKKKKSKSKAKKKKKTSK